MFNIFRPKTHPYLLLMKSGSLNSVFDPYPYLENNEKVAIITLLVLISRVNGDVSRNKIFFLEDLTQGGPKGIWNIDKNKHPLTGLPEQVGFVFVINELKGLRHHNKAKLFNLMSAIIEVDGGPSFHEMIYVAKIVEEIGCTLDEYDAAVSKVKLFLSTHKHR